MSHTPYNSNNNSQSLVGRTNVASGASFGGGGGRVYICTNIFYKRLLWPANNKNTYT